MADKYATPVLEEGVYAPPVKGDLTGRRDPILGTIRDTVLETAAGAIDVLATPYTAGRMYGSATGNEKFETAGQLGQQVASQTKDWIRSGKTDFGRQEDLNGGENATWLSRAAEALPPAIPAIGTALMTGIAAPLTYGALAHGQQSQQFEELLYKMPREELEQLEGYKKHKAKGLDHDQIMQQMHVDMRGDWKAWAPNVGANILFGGVASHLVGKIGSRSVAQTMKDRIIKRVLPDIGEAVGGGYATGFAQSAGRQTGQITAGARQGYDLGEMHAEGTDIASVITPLGVASGLTGLRGPRTPAGVDTTGKLIDDANKKVAPAIGTEQQVVAIDNLKGNNIGTAETPPAPKPGETIAPTTPTTPAAGVTPPGSAAAAPPSEAPPAPPAPTGATGPAQHVGTRPDGSHEWQWPGADATHYATVGADGQVLSRGQSGGPGPATTPVDPAVAAGVTTPEGSLAAGFKNVQEELQNLTQQRRSLDAASPDQKATLEWREESQRIDQELERVNQLAAASPIPAAAPSAAAGPTLPTPPVAAGVEPKAPTAPTAPTAPAEAAAPKMTLDELKARVADPAQTPTLDALNQAIKEYKDQHGLKKLPEHNAVTQAWSAGKTQATKAAGEQKKVQQQAAREAKQAEAAQLKITQDQAKGYAKKAREQAQALKAEKKAKAKVTQEGKASTETKDVTTAKAPGPEKATAPAEAKPAGDTTQARAPADEPVNTATLRAKLGLKAPGEGVTHGKAAEPVIAKLTEERQQKAAQAWDPVSKRQTKEAKTKARSAAKAASRDEQTTIRENTAKQVMEDHKPGANYAAELESVEAAVKDGKADAPEVKSHVAQVVADVKEMITDYKDRLHTLAGGTDHPVFRYATGKGFEVTKGGKEKAASAARRGKGEHHGFFAEMSNYVQKVEAALKKGDDARAKELTLRYLENSKLVREGEIAKVTEAAQKASDEVGSQKKTNKPSEAQVALSEAQLAKIRFEEEQAREADKRTTAEMTKEQAHAKGLPWPEKDAKGRVTRWIHPDITGLDPNEWVGGTRLALDPHRYKALNDALQEYWENVLNKSGPLNWNEIASVARQMGETIETRTLGEDLLPHRPEHPLLQIIFDRVYDMVKDMPSHTISVELAQAMSEGSRAFYMPTEGATYFRPDTKVGRTVFHEALHAATARALHGSQRLQRLVSRLQAIVRSRYRHSPAGQASLAYQKAIDWVNDKGDTVLVDQHEFISELFTRPDVFQMVKQINLRPSEVAILTKEGYAVDKGKTLLGTMWDTFLDIIGFKPERPSALKTAVDMFTDTLEREMAFRARDEALGITQIGIMDENVIQQLAAEDPVHGTAAHQAMIAGNHAEAARNLVAMADRMDEATADASIKYLQDVNGKLWGGKSLPDRVPPIAHPDTIRNDVSKFFDDRFGNTARDWAWQFDNKFGTPIRNFVSGLTYTNDIGATLETAFQNVLKPLKDAWSRREHFAQKYMDESGANKLIDKIATTKNAIKDRQLWADWEQLMIRESYSRSRADEEIGVGANDHLRSGDLRDRQSIADHAKNRVLLEAIKARNPELIALRNEVFDFTKKEQVQRHKASIRDMLRQMKVVDHGDELAISALTKDVMRDNKAITAAERTALDRALKLGKESDAYRNWEIERDRLEHSVGKADPTYTKHMAKETKLLTELTSKQYETYKKNREDIRKLIDPGFHKGPHVPFMRHGNHAVYSEFDITPDKGVKYNEVEPTADLHRQFDFVSRADAENFIDNTLSHDAVNVTVNNAYEVVYDKNTGARAAHWTVEKPDRTATTYESQEAAEAAMGKGDKITKTDTKPEDIQAMKEDGRDVSHLEVRHRVVFNPREFVKFESEREAHEYRDRLAGDSGHPNMVTRTSNVESEHQMVGRANVAYTSAEMRQWINRQEASPEYQRMDPSEKEDWARKLRVEAARVTATAGRRSAMMPRDYTRGASTDLLKGMIDYGGSNARAIADLTYRADIDKGLVDAEAYVDKYRNQSGGLGKDHRARDDSLIEIKRRLFEPPKVEGSWAQGVRRALQVSMISHLADTAYLIVNAIEPWVFGASVTAARHGWAGAYREQIEATRLVDPTVLAKQVWSDLGEAWRSEFGGANPYEDLLLRQVNSPGNPRGDGVGLDLMMKHMFNKGLAARDVGMEVERIHDPSKSMLFRGLDWMDGLFRAANTGIETQNRATMAIANYRLEYNRALRDMGLPEPKSETYKVDGITHTRSDYTFNQKAHDQAVRYAEDSIFKGAGDYSQWNNPRYFNNPMLRLATQFKKYPLRIASVYADAMMGALKGDGEKQKQLAYMLIAQSVAAGGMGLPIMSPVAGLTNALYLLGITDGNYEDMELWIRKQMASRIGVTATDLAMHGAFRFTGADFSQKMSQSSFIFRGSPASRKPEDVVMSLMKVAGGAPTNVLKKGLDGIQKLGEAAGDMSTGATTQGMVKGMEGVSGFLQVKALEDLMKMGGMMMGGVKGAPSTQKVTAGQVAATAVGFTPTSLADRRAAKAAVNLEKKRDQEWRTRWVNRYRDARTPGEETAIWASIQKENAGLDPEMRIKFEDLWKAKQRKKREEARDDTKLGVKLSGRQKSFADTSKYFSVN